MKTLIKAMGLIALISLATSVLMAQWPAVSTPGVPKTADGKPDLTGPVPRTPDGKPDLSGIWQNGGGGNGAGGGGRGGAATPGAGPAGGPGGGGRGGAATPGAGPAGGPGGGAGAPTAGAAGAAGGGQRGGQGGGRGAAANPNPNNLPPGTVAPGAGIPNATFGNIGSGFPGGLPFQPWAKELMEQRNADNSKDNPDAHCLPMGFMQFHTHPEPRKIVQTPGMVLIIYEANSGLRQIFTDGRSLPGKDAQPWWYGYSVGKWEGDTLVVETTGFIDKNVWLDVRGSPLSDAAKVTEKFRRVNFGNLEIEVTIDDPKAYTKPFTVKVNQRLMLDTELIEFICEDRDSTHYIGAK